MLSEHTNTFDLLLFGHLLCSKFSTGMNKTPNWSGNLNMWQFWPGYKGLQDPPKYLMTLGQSSRALLWEHLKLLMCTAVFDFPHCSDR